MLAYQLVHIENNELADKLADKIKLIKKDDNMTHARDSEVTCVHAFKITRVVDNLQWLLNKNMLYSQTILATAGSIGEGLDCPIN